ncbi:class I SAM-dependent methyltransferase [bacterium]|nr:class I SAM-dependent methyltransferase [bacterium]
MSQFVELLAQLVHGWDRFYGKARNVLERVLNALAYGAYRAERSQGTGRGYRVRREKEVLAALRDPSFSVHRLPRGFGIGLDERIIEYPWAISRLPNTPGKLLDAGSVLNWDYLLRQPNLANKRVFISTLAPETQSFWWRGVSYTYEDLRRPCFRSDYFDWIVCLSTIEHVGLDNSVYTIDPAKKESRSGDYLAFLAELRNLLRPGGTLLLSFPFGKAAQHGWLQVFDLQAVDKMVSEFHPQMHSQNFFQYTPSGWKACSPQDASEALYFGRGANTDGNPLKIPAAEAVACLELVK